MTCIESTITGDRLEPDLVLGDLHAPVGGSDHAIRPATRALPTRTAVGIVVLSQHHDPSCGFDVDDLVSAINEVTWGGFVDAPAVIRHRRPSPGLDRLTPREREILAEMAEGKNNAAIAASLVLSQRAIEKHINSIFSKLGLTDEPNVNRRVKAVLLHLERTGQASAA